MQAPLSILLAGLLALSGAGAGVGGTTAANVSDDQLIVPRFFSIGKPIDPKIELEDLGGRPHRFGSYQEKVIALVFWSPRCQWTRRMQPKLNALEREFSKEGVQFFAIASNVPDIEQGREDGFEEMREIARKTGVRYPVLKDPGFKVADRFRATTTPQVFVIDREGILRYSGGIDDDPREELIAIERENWLYDALQAVLAGNRVPEPETKPFGFSIRRQRSRLGR